MPKQSEIPRTIFIYLFKNHLFGSQELLSGPSTWMQDPKTLGRPPLVSQVISRELDRNWSSQDLDRDPYGMLVLQTKDSAYTTLPTPTFLFYNIHFP